MTICCDECAYCDKATGAPVIPDAKNFGWCRKAPPVAEIGREAPYAVWPAVILMVDWCGEFRRHEEGEN